MCSPCFLVSCARKLKILLENTVSAQIWNLWSPIQATSGSKLGPVVGKDSQIHKTIRVRPLENLLLAGKVSRFFFLKPNSQAPSFGSFEGICLRRHTSEVRPNVHHETNIGGFFAFELKFPCYFHAMPSQLKVHLSRREDGRAPGCRHSEQIAYRQQLRLPVR
jgi:hypothetical protein